MVEPSSSATVPLMEASTPTRVNVNPEELGADDVKVISSTLGSP